MGKIRQNIRRREAVKKKRQQHILHIKVYQNEG